MNQVAIDELAARTVAVADRVASGAAWLMS